MIEEIEELNDLMSHFENEALIEQNKVLSRLLIRNGVKIREHKWTELEAS
ncbi:MAG: hypothetical protein ABIJ08_06625 [Nanoarchaeota archaeon]